jgi:hypothetical protein
MFVDFRNIDRRPARRAGQESSAAIAPIADLDRRDEAQATARRALAALSALAAVGTCWFFFAAPGVSAACVLAFTIATSGWAAVQETR